MNEVKTNGIDKWSTASSISEWERKRYTHIRTHNLFGKIEKRVILFCCWWVGFANATNVCMHVLSRSKTVKGDLNVLDEMNQKREKNIIMHVFHLKCWREQQQHWWRRQRWRWRWRGSRRKIKLSQIEMLLSRAISIDQRSYTTYTYIYFSLFRRLKTFHFNYEFYHLWMILSAPANRICAYVTWVVLTCGICGLRLWSFMCVCWCQLIFPLSSNWLRYSINWIYSTMQCVVRAKKTLPSEAILISLLSRFHRALIAWQESAF